MSLFPNHIDPRKVFSQIRRFGHGLWSGLKFYAVGIYRKADEDHLFLISAGLSFSLIICIIPLVLIVFSVLGIILERTSISDMIDTYIESVIPYEQVAAQVKDVIFSRVQEFRLYKTVAGLAGLVGLFMAASGLFGSMRTILNRVYRMPDTLSTLKGKLRDFWLVLLVLIYFLVAMLVFPLAEVVLDRATSLPIIKEVDLAFMESALVELFSFVVVTFLYGSIYYMVPYNKPPRKAVVVSAIATAFLWSVAKILFGVYLSRAVMFKRIYGTYVFLVAVAFWIYYSSIVFTVGAQIGRLFQERRMQS